DAVFGHEVHGRKNHARHPDRDVAEARRRFAAIAVVRKLALFLVCAGARRERERKRKRDDGGAHFHDAAGSAFAPRPRAPLSASPLRRRCSRPMATTATIQSRMRPRLIEAKVVVDQARRAPSQTTPADSTSPTRTKKVSTAVLPTYFSAREAT